MDVSVCTKEGLPSPPLRKGSLSRAMEQRQAAVPKDGSASPPFQEGSASPPPREGSASPLPKEGSASAPSQEGSASPPLKRVRLPHFILCHTDVLCLPSCQRRLGEPTSQGGLGEPTFPEKLGERTIYIRLRPQKTMSSGQRFWVVRTCKVTYWMVRHFASTRKVEWTCKEAYWMVRHFASTRKASLPSQVAYHPVGRLEVPGKRL